jgi:hypothetical protein
MDADREDRNADEATKEALLMPTQVTIYHSFTMVEQPLYYHGLLGTVLQ